MRGSIGKRSPSNSKATIRPESRRRRSRFASHERRSDLSPDGQYLIYFAGKFRTPNWTWTAISKPPALTAIARWPKDDAWGGGGLFESATRIGLNHRAEEMALAPGSELPPSFEVHPLAPWAGRGEDDPIWRMRLTRDGWLMAQEGTVVRREKGAPVRGKSTHRASGRSGTRSSRGATR